MSEVLAARGLKKTYRNGPEVLEVIKGIDLTVERGESLSIVGISGAGKSTLLHILGTLDSPTSGEVFWEKASLSSLSERERDQFRKDKMGFIFQFYHLLPEFSALENVMLASLIGPGRKDPFVQAKRPHRGDRPDTPSRGQSPADRFGQGGIFAEPGFLRAPSGGNPRTLRRPG